jgi:hypothetical protein
MKIGQRQAQLHQEYAVLYPGFPCQEWRPVAEVLNRIVATRAGGSRGSARLYRKRLLDDRHFAFRGGTQQARRCGVRSRSSDGTLELVSPQRRAGTPRSTRLGILKPNRAGPRSGG